MVKVRQETRKIHIIIGLRGIVPLGKGAEGTSAEADAAR
jgi:hypothetical protein